MTSYLIGIDNGSQSTKVTIFDESGTPVSQGRRPLRPNHTPAPGVVEHPDDDLWTSVAAACREAMAGFDGDPAAIVGETPASGTIPLFLLDDDYVRGVFGTEAEALLLGAHPEEKISDVVSRPQHYADIVMGIREDFRKRHSPAARLRDLIEIIEA